MKNPFEGSMDKTGNWTGWAKMLQTAEQDLSNESKKIVQRGAISLSSFVKRNLVDGGNTAGQPFLPLSLKTIQAKGSTKPLIDTMDMTNSVKATNRDPWSWFVGITGEAKGKDGETTIAEYAAAHEFGFIKKSDSPNFTSLDGKKSGVSMIPARPWFWPVVEKKKKEIIDKMEGKFQKIFEVKK